MLNWIKDNYPLLPGIILLIYSFKYYNRKVWYWISIDDEISKKGFYLKIIGFILIILGYFIKVSYLI